MGKVFVEYHSDNGRIPYSAHDLLCCLTQYVRSYIATERRVFEKVDPNVRDAVLIDAINYMGTFGAGCNFGVNTDDLYSGQVDKAEVDGQSLLTVILNFYAQYTFQHGIVQSVRKNKHMNKCTEDFDVNDGAAILIDFMDYVAEVNGFDKKFTLQDLYQKFQQQEYKYELKQLKSFLEKVSTYGERLEFESVDDIFAQMAAKRNLDSISEDGTYYQTSVDNTQGVIKMDAWQQEMVEDDIYAMAYAYAKMGDTSFAPKTQIINQKIQEMKKR